MISSTSKRILRSICAIACASGLAWGNSTIDIEALGNSLGGWKKRGSNVEYELSGSTYRTFRPEISPTPCGGIFVSIRIDHVRGWLASNDHAVLELTVSREGAITSAKSSIAIQGHAITSDLIRAGSEAGPQLTAVDRSVKIGTDLVADLSSKLLRERIVESGRVTFPAVLRHNYNMLFQAIRTTTPEAGAGEATAPEKKPPVVSPLDIDPYATPKGSDLPVEPAE